MTAPDHVRITDVAAHAGVSISTVSAALNGTRGVSEATRAHIVAVAAQLGYRPDARARRLRRTRTRLIGVAYAPGQGFQEDLVDGLYRACARAGYEVMLAAATRHHDERSCLESLLNNRCEALALIGSTAPAARLAEVAARVPVVVLAQDPVARGVDVVNTRDRYGMHLLVDHLVASGRRRLTYADGGDSTRTGLRARAFVDAARAAGLGRGAVVLPGGRDEESGVRVARTLLAADPLPDALITFNDHAAVGALAELRRRGLRVPHDLALAGYDGIALGAVSAIGLTTVEQDVLCLAEVAVDRLLARLDRGEPSFLRWRRDPHVEVDDVDGDVRIEVTPRLVVRESTAT